MTIQVNGNAREVSEGLTVADLLRQLGFAGDRVAVERNREILPRAQWAATRLSPGDTFEIVHFVGGGRETDDRTAHLKT
ncbi:MAG: sulfur carrier protein ThiS [Acidobacteria bacterium]|nr:sulfur carrier protein ThiS [Acidobacteriota bacterium]